MKIKPINSESLHLSEPNVESAKKIDKFHQSNIKQEILVPDPDGQLTPHAYKIIKRERFIRFLGTLFWFCLMLFGIIGVLIVRFVPNNIKGQALTNNPVGWYILFGILITISLIFFIRNIFDLISWRNTTKKIRESFVLGDQSASLMFHKTYRSVVIKNVRTLWAVIFFETFFGIYILITYLLYYYFIAQKNQVEINWKLLNLHITGDLGIALNNLYGGKVVLLLIIGTTILISVIALQIILWIYDKKRINDLSAYLGADVHNIIERVQQSKENENKMWLKIYIFTFIGIIFLPALLLFIAVWRGIFKRK